MKAKVLLNSPILAKVTLTYILILTVITPIFTRANTAEAQVVTEGLVSYWSFDSVAGKRVQDDWGQNHGTIEGAPQKVAGRFGLALEFDGVKDQIVVPNDDSLTIVDEITLCAWIFWNGITGIIVSKRDPVSYQFSAIQAGNPNTIQLCCPTCIYSDAALAANEWIHIAAVRSKDKIYFYKDGESAGIFDEANAWVTNNADVIIGGWPGDGYKYGGILDELSIYNQALSAKEIKQNFAAKGLAVSPSAGKVTLTWGRLKTSK